MGDPLAVFFDAFPITLRGPVTSANIAAMGRIAVRCENRAVERVIAVPIEASAFGNGDDYILPAPEYTALSNSNRNSR